MTILDGFSGSVGNTPLIRLKALSAETGCDILGKAEFLNPGGSVKDRAARAIIEDAERRGTLEPGGTVFFVDNKRNFTSLDHQQLVAEHEDYVVERELNDRRRFRIVKVFHEPARLEAKLGELGWQASVRATGEFFLYGRAVSR